MIPHAKRRLDFILLHSAFCLRFRIRGETTIILVAVR